MKSPRLISTASHNYDVFINDLTIALIGFITEAVVNSKNIICLVDK